jgi:threonine dehydrogenase-like Zn-dependent dehydrogenase
VVLARDRPERQVGVVAHPPGVVLEGEVEVAERGAHLQPGQRLGGRAPHVGALVGPDKLGERLGNIDVVYEAAGASRASFELLKFLGTNGVFIFTGVPGRKAPVEVDTDLIMRNLVLKNQVVYGTVNAGPEAFESAIRNLGEFMTRWPDAVRSLITGRFPMDAYRDLLLGAPKGIKNVITVG